MSRQCRAPKNNFRYLYENTNSQQEEGYDPYSKEEGSCSNQTVSTSGECYVLREEGYTKKSQATSKKQVKIRKPEKNYPQDIINLATKINESNTKPYSYSQVLCSSKVEKDTATVITRTHSETARNKPIVKGLINECEAKMLLDTGADINIIDKFFAQNVLNLKLEQSRKNSSYIKCANGSSMKVVGTVYLAVKIGKSINKIEFRIVENLFPRVILGIVALKQLKISLCPESSCAIVKNEKVPFLSKVDSTPGECYVLREEG